MSRDTGRLDGATVLIVGAGTQTHGLDDAPIGNGRAIAVAAAREGARLVLADDLRWTAPAHAPIEALRTVRRYETAGLLTAAQAQSVAKEVLAAEVEYVGTERWLLASVWRAPQLERLRRPLRDDRAAPQHPTGDSRSQARDCRICRRGSGGRPHRLRQFATRS